jgi:hypothetical protein
MGFADDVKKWTGGAKANIDAAVKQDVQNAGVVLERVLGEDAKKITGGAYDVSAGKFYGVVAPPDVLERMRKANLLKD